MIESGEKDKKTQPHKHIKKSWSSGKILSFALNVVELDSSRDGCMQGKNTFLFLAEVPSPKAEGGGELRGAHHHLGRPRANNLLWKQDGYLHYRLSRPTPWRHQQHELTAEVPKPGGRCLTALWKLVLAPRSLLSQVLLITCVHRVTLSNKAPHPHKDTLVVIVLCGILLLYTLRCVCGMDCLNLVIVYAET